MAGCYWLAFILYRVWIEKRSMSLMCLKNQNRFLHFTREFIYVWGLKPTKDQTPSTMRRLILFAFLASMGLASCKRDFACQCTYGDDYEEGKESFEYEDVKKEDAVDACNEKESSLQVTHDRANCELVEK